MMCGVVTGCGSDTSALAPSETANGYYALILNQHAINMSLAAPTNTMQLSVLARGADNIPLADVNPVTYRVTDSSVTVSPSGLLTAHYVTSSGVTQVIATMQRGQVTRADTAYIQITETAPSRLATFSIRPVAGDSAVGTVNRGYTPNITATDVNGNPIIFDLPGGDGNLAWFESANHDVAYAELYNNDFYLNDTGHVTLHVTSWFYGVPVQDSLVFIVGWPLQDIIYMYDGTPVSFSQGTRFLGVGGKVIWQWAPDDIQQALDIVFGDSADVDSATASAVWPNTGGGNIHLAVFDPDLGFDRQARSFPKAGIYRYHNRVDSTATATIYVFNNPKH